MKAMKRIFVYLLALTMLASATVCMNAGAFADDLKPITMETSDIDNQLTFIYSQINSLKQNDSDNTWYYTVTDLDHDGNLEFIAASQHPQDRSTNLKIWEVGADRNSLNECSLDKDPDESFPDILTDVADTFHDTASNTWNYLFYDNVVLSPTDVYTSKSSYRLKDGVISYEAYAVEHTIVDNGRRSVSHTDATGTAISADQYDAAGVNAFAGTERSSTNFEWLTASDAGSLMRLIDSYAVFSGVKAPTETFPVPKPEALNVPEVTPAPVVTDAPVVPTPAPAPEPAPVYLTVTKNPTNENRTEGDTALFVSCANAFESLTWTMVAPDGGEYSIPSFRSLFGNASVTGDYSTTLSIANVSTSMNNWGAYCTFYYKGQTARTSTAYMYVGAKSKGAPSGTYSGTVTSWNYSTVTIWAENTVSITIPFGKCDVDGDLFVGAYASFNWNGSDVTYCYISGSKQPVTPIYGSMGGTAYEGGGGYAVNLSNGTQVYVDSWKCNVSGWFYDGASCVVYYENYPSSDNIYSCDIYGSPYNINDVNPYDWDLPYTTYDERIANGGGWAGANYYDNEPVYYVGGAVEFDPWDDIDYDPIGDEHNRVTCPNCGNHFSPGLEECPVCGWSP